MATILSILSATILSILSAIQFLIKYGPAMYAFMQELWEKIRTLRTRGRLQEAAAFEAEAVAAWEHYKVTRNRRPLRELLCRLTDTCEAKEA